MRHLKKLYIAIAQDGYVRDAGFSGNELTSILEHEVLNYCPYLPPGCEEKSFLSSLILVTSYLEFIPGPFIIS